MNLIRKYLNKLFKFKNNTIKNWHELIDQEEYYNLLSHSKEIESAYCNRSQKHNGSLYEYQIWEYKNYYKYEHYYFVIYYFWYNHEIVSNIEFYHFYKPEEQEILDNARRNYHLLMIKNNKLEFITRN